MGGNSNQTTGNVPAPVSSGREQLILVDSDDRVVGHGSKATVHAGDGALHRAFSVFLFDERQRVLLHRRSGQKPLWGGYWTNSCCSHPRRGEQINDAVTRRLREELGVSAPSPRHVYRFEYRAEFGTVGSEHELCHVFLARLDRGAAIRAHREEIAEWRWCDVAEVDALMAARRSDLTPWFRMEWQALRGRYRNVFDSFLLDPVVL